MDSSGPTSVTRVAWEASALRNPHAQPDKSTRVEAMFNAIAPTYERVNHVASLGQDRAWRRRAVSLVRPTAKDVVLDVCCGTGDMIRTFAAHSPPPRLLIGVDFAAGMLARGAYRGISTPIQLCRGDGQRLPIAGSSVDIVSCAFGIRNLQSLDAGLAEFRRVLRAGGRVLILEFALPDNRLIRVCHRIYCERVLPWVGSALSGDRTGAYRYLPSSIRTFEGRAAMTARLEAAGFTSVRSVSMNFGGVVAYCARR